MKEDFIRKENTKNLNSITSEKKEVIDALVDKFLDKYFEIYEHTK